MQNFKCLVYQLYQPTVASHTIKLYECTNNLVTKKNDSYYTLINIIITTPPLAFNLVSYVIMILINNVKTQPKFTSFALSACD